jgi:hypothetical protein
MNEVVQNLERQLDGAASSSRSENPEAARELARAAEQIRESKLKEKIQYSRGTIEQWDPQSAVTMELQIEGDLQALRDQLEAARDASAQRTSDPLREALDETRDLVRGMEAMDRRLNESGSESQAGEEQEGQGGDSDGEASGEQGERGRDEQGQQGGQGGSEQGEGAEGQARGGGLGGDGRAGDRTADSPFGGATRGDPRRFTPEEIRQFRREFRERSDQARELRQGLERAGQDVEDIEAVLDAMARLQEEATYADPAALADLQEDLVNRLKRVEFSLRREVEGEADRRATLTGSDEVPDGYRSLVEEYYRALARGGSGRD